MTIAQLALRQTSQLLLVVACCFGVLIPTLLSAQTTDVFTDTASTDATEVLESLVTALQDDETREALVTELQTLLESADATDTTDEASADSAEEMSIGRRIATFTQTTVEEAVAWVFSLWASVTSGDNVFSGLSGSEASVLLDAVKDLFVVIVVTIAAYITLRMTAIPIYRRMGAKRHDATLISTVFLFLGSNLLDFFVVLLAWGIGYAVAIFAVGEFGEIGIQQALYLNAFLIVEIAKAVVRVVLSPNADGLRLFPVTRDPAKRFYRILSIVISLIGYGQLLVVPIINTNASNAAGVGVEAIIYVLVLLYLIFSVLRYRRGVGDWIVDGLRGEHHTAPHDPAPAQLFVADADSEGSVSSSPQDYEMGDDTVAAESTGMSQRQSVSGSMLEGLGHRWHWAALAYLMGMFVIVISQSSEVVLAAVLGTVRVVTVIVVVSLVTGGLARVAKHGLHVPSNMRQYLPLLEPRLNAFIRRATRITRFVILAIAGLFVLDAVSLINLSNISGSNFGLRAIDIFVSLALIGTVAFAVWLAMTCWVDYRLNPDYGSQPSSRETTLLTLLRNAATITIIILTLMFGLSEIGLNIGPLLASAGVLGLAIGFGAQKMVQDIITGVFIQFENAINVGDVINVNGTTGMVEKLSVRSVGLRDVEGTVHLIPFSSVDMVSNYSRDFSYFVCDMGVAYREDIAEVRKVMFECFEQLKKDPEQGMFVRDDMEWFGLNSFGDSAIVLRARIKTQPGKQWGVGRAYNGYLKVAFDAQNIEIPFPHQTLVFAEAKDGTTQAFHVNASPQEDKEA